VLTPAASATRAKGCIRIDSSSMKVTSQRVIPGRVSMPGSGCRQLWRQTYAEVSLPPEEDAGAAVQNGLILDEVRRGTVAYEEKAAAGGAADSAKNFRLPYVRE
jgi:hypothetical protein